MQTALWLLKKAEMLDEPHQPTKALIWFNLNWGGGGGGGGVGGSGLGTRFIFNRNRAKHQNVAINQN